MHSDRATLLNEYYYYYYFLFFFYFCYDFLGKRNTLRAIHFGQ